VEGLDNAVESQQIGQELIKLNVIRPVGCTDFQPRPGNYYFFMVRWRGAKGSAQETSSC